MPNRFSTLRVSMVCSAGTSTRSSECSGRKGMLEGVGGVERRCWVPCVARELVLVYADVRYGELVGSRQVLRQRGDRSMGDISGGNKAMC